MGHQLSKSKANNNSRNKTQSSEEREQHQHQRQQQQQLPAIAAAAAAAEEEEEDSLEASAEVRQIIIKIQLAKMENGNAEEEQQQELEQEQPLLEQEQQLPASVDSLNANNQILNVTLDGRVVVASAAGAAAAATAATAGAPRTAGSSTEAPKTSSSSSNNNNNNNNSNLTGCVASASAAVKTLQLHDVDVVVNHDDDESEIAETSLRRWLRSSGSTASNEGVEYCEVLEPQPVNEMFSTREQRSEAQAGNSCCHNRSLATNGTVRRCSLFCRCRERLRGLRDRMSSSSRRDSAAAAVTTPTRSKSRSSSVADRRSTPPTIGATGGVAIAAATATRRQQRNSVAVAEPSQLAIWAAPTNVIIRISSQPQSQPLSHTQSQIVMESVPIPVSVPGAGCNCTFPPVVHMAAGSGGIRLMAAPKPAAALPSQSQIQSTPRPATAPYGVGVTVHSQIDFMHCLVPDLKQIINSSYYWGKMDRYEAERLLEGKPEGTFLLRDSAQEEFLFSVTFRKYGRSLHARIEQSGHKFSFDCHDPCVFTALTVTGLLEHYKDPSCVMFFEPCLTMPLHRRQTFSLQQLARATIVSNTTYDGINQLELPGRLKSYLKEYHYKQKLRVKPCDAHTPAPYYANI